MPARYPPSGTITPVEFEDRVRAVLRALQPGDVVTYGEVAEEAGFPGAARAVGNVLRRSGPDELPWWRVVAASGRLAPGKEGEQGRRLRGEGVEVSDGRVRRGRQRRAAATPRPPTGRSRGR
jgi:methylated-DNA-protein-cysteine methyltransferase-like protein